MNLPGRVFAGRWVCPGLEIQAPAHFWSGEPLGGWASASVCPWTTELQAYTQTPAALPRVRALQKAWPGLSLHPYCFQWVRGRGSLSLGVSHKRGEESCLFIKMSLLPPWVTYFSFVYKLAFPFNFYLFLVAFKTAWGQRGCLLITILWVFEGGSWEGKMWCFVASL